MRWIIWGGGAMAGASSLGLILLVLLLLSPLMQSALPADTAMGGTAPASGLVAPGPEASKIVSAAKSLSERIYGPSSNEYVRYRSDPLLAKAYQYWLTSCGNGVTMCPQGVSGNLQCVLFVTGVFYLAGIPLPAIGNGIDFWPLYQQRGPQWIAIKGPQYNPSERGLPAPGDIISWAGGRHWDTGTQQYVEWGHVAIVIGVMPPDPVAHKDGSVTVAQANAGGTRWPASHRADPANWYTMPIKPDRSIPTWGGFSDAAGTWWSSYMIQGFVRYHASH